MPAPEPFVRSVELSERGADEERVDHPWDMAVVQGLSQGLTLHPSVTYFVGENGSGKSTLIEAIAVAAGMNAEGGSRNFSYATRESHSELWRALRLVRGARRPATDFFLRSESFFTTATQVDALFDGGPTSYGNRSLHQQSHGESFLSLFVHRFGPNGLYILDEPEAALSPQGCLSLLRRIHDLVSQGSQFIIATHSPLVLAYPESTIYSCEPDGIHETEYESAEPARITQTFLATRDRFVERLLAD